MALGASRVSRPPRLFVKKDKLFEVITFYKIFKIDHAVTAGKAADMVRTVNKRKTPYDQQNPRTF